MVFETVQENRINPANKNKGKDPSNFDDRKMTGGLFIGEAEVFDEGLPLGECSSL